MKGGPARQENLHSEKKEKLIKGHCCGLLLEVEKILARGVEECYIQNEMPSGFNPRVQSLRRETQFLQDALFLFSSLFNTIEILRVPLRNIFYSSAPRKCQHVLVLFSPILLIVVRMIY
jgi:hypothetical protein